MSPQELPMDEQGEKEDVDDVVERSNDGGGGGGEEVRWPVTCDELQDSSLSLTGTMALLRQLIEPPVYPDDPATKAQLVACLLVVMEKHDDVVGVQTLTLECLNKLIDPTIVCPTTTVLRTVVRTMSHFPHNAALQSAACSVLCRIHLESLDPDDPKTRQELPAPDDTACALVAAARHTGGVELQILGLESSTTFIRAQMIDNPYPSMLTRIGLCEAAVAAMDAHKPCVDLQLAGLYAILSLSRAAFHIIDVDVPARLQSSGAHGATLRAMRWHTSNKEVSLSLTMNPYLPLIPVLLINSPGGGKEKSHTICLFCLFGADGKSPITKLMRRLIIGGASMTLVHSSQPCDECGPLLKA